MLVLYPQKLRNTYQNMIQDCNSNTDNNLGENGDTSEPELIYRKYSNYTNPNRHSHERDPLPRIRIAIHSSKLVTAECVQICPTRGAKLSKWDLNQEAIVDSPAVTILQ
ncbi:unnamed protein product [Euphydryas editha]|uniref:Uncharacterized protein n=1 Tax=Euphydryas editha TaxID=104508 RepID=A0AAU9URA6_EUPED|nr:unnamed protein product [Euphydryas editha]